MFREYKECPRSFLEFVLKGKGTDTMGMIGNMNYGSVVHLPGEKSTFPSPEYPLGNPVFLAVNLKSKLDWPGENEVKVLDGKRELE